MSWPQGAAPTPPSPAAGALAPGNLPIAKHQISICAATDPFRTRRILAFMPEGLTVAEYLRAAAPRGFDPRLEAHAFLDGEPLGRDRWDTTRPAAGTALEIRVLPGGGDTGKNVLRAVLTIAIISVAMWTGGAAAAGLGLVKGTLAYSLTAGFIASGIGAVAIWGMNQLMPPPALLLPGSAAQKDEPAYRITGTRNEINRFGTIPVVFGKHRMYPPHGAMPYTETIGGDQYIRMLLIPGYGPLTITDIRIGNIPISDYEEVECEIRNGWPDDTPLELFSTDVFEENPQAELTAAEGWITRQSQENTDELSVDVTFPYGLTGYDASGNRINRSVAVDLEYRKLPDGEWLPNADPTVQNLCPPAADWILEGGATYDAGTGEITLPAGGKAIIMIEVNYSTRFWFTAKYYDADASTFFTPDAGRVLHIEYAKRIYINRGDDDEEAAWNAARIRNEAGELETEDWTSYPISSWAELTYDGIAGNLVKNIEITVENRSPYTSASYKFKEPTLVTAQLFYVTAKTTSAITRTARWLVERGQYQVRLRRNTAAANDRQIDATFWTALRSHGEFDPINKTGLAKIALRIKSTENFKGQLDQVSCMASSHLPIYDPDTQIWDDTQESENPAWAYAQVLRGPANDHAVADTRLDLIGLATWAAHCDSAGWKIGGIIDGNLTVKQTLDAVAKTGRAGFAMPDGKYSVAEDIVKAYAIQHFTPRNSSNFSFTKLFQKIPHALRVRFLNEAADYLEDEITVYDDGYDANNATEFDDLELWGITSAARAYKEARFYLAGMRLRPEIWKLNVDVENLICTKGDRVAVMNDIALVGLTPCRMTGWEILSPSEGYIYLDEPVTMEAGKYYGIRWRTSDGSDFSSYNKIITEPGTTKTLHWNNVLTGSPEEGALVMFGERTHESQDMIVTGIAPGPDLTAELTMVHYNAAIYSADTGTIPDFDPNITQPPEDQLTPAIPHINQIRSDESVILKGGDGTLTVRILIELQLQIGTGAAVDYMQCRYRESDSGAGWTWLGNLDNDTKEISIAPVIEGQTYDVAIRAVSRHGRASNWANEMNHLVIGKTSRPPDVTALFLNPPSMLQWSYPDPPADLAGFQVRIREGNNPTWEGAALIHDGLIPFTWFDIAALTGGTKTFMVKAFDTTGNESANAAALVKDLGDPPSENIITTTDIEASSFPGILIQGDLSSTDLLAHDAGGFFWSGSPSKKFWSGTDSDLFWTDDYLEMLYIFDFAATAPDIPSKLWLDYTIDALKEIRYRRGSTIEEDDFNRASLGADWTSNGSGTWDIDSNKCRCQSASTDDELWWKTEAPAGQETIITITVNADTSNTGIIICGAVIKRLSGAWSVGGTAGLGYAFHGKWIAVVRADNTIDFYAGAHYIGSTTADASNRKVGPFVGAASITQKWDDFEMRSGAEAWQPWPGMVNVEDTDPMEIAITTQAGSTQGKIDALKVRLDVPDVIEYFSSVTISASGTRLTLTKSYRAIDTIQLTVEDYVGNTAISAWYADKDATNGPQIFCLDATGAKCAGKISATVKGY